jgi:CHAT domain-containing protein
MERIKSRNLIGESARLKIPLPAGYPADWIAREQNVKKELVALKGQINRNLNLQDSLGNQVLNLTIELKQLRESVQKLYPGYYQQRYGVPVFSIAQFRKAFLNQETACIEYFATYRQLQVALITQDTIILWTKDFPILIADKVQQLISALTAKNLMGPKVLDSLKHTSFELYQILLDDPLKAAGPGIKKLILGSDASLGQLPFGALLTALPSNNKFSNWPYLLKQYTLQYTTSAAFLMAQQPSVGRDTTSLGFFAGFAPMYPESDSAFQNRYRSGLIRSGDYDLPAAREEVKALGKLTNGRTWLGAEATETAFRENCGYYQILHLAMHGLANNLQPDLSKVLFSAGVKDATAETDGDLTAGEVLNLHIPANLVVLSACHSGAGRATSGEGVLSLSYSFAAAGAQSVVSSLWQASDTQTKQLMEQFYQSLLKGLPKDEALRQAQLYMISHPEGDTDATAHPFFWAPFVLYGSCASLR